MNTGDLGQTSGEGRESAGPEVATILQSLQLYFGKIGLLPLIFKISCNTILIRVPILELNFLKIEFFIEFDFFKLYRSVSLF